MDIIKKILEFVMDILETITFVGSIFIVVYLFLFQPHQVKGASMEKTFYNGEYIITSKIAYRIGQIKHGDVIVFRAPTNPDHDYIKRIIGLPGDRIRIADTKVYVNGDAIKEPYINTNTTLYVNGFLKENEEITIPEGGLFVMGDHRTHSSDSREFGIVSQSSIVGKVVFRYFPPDKAGWIKNPFEDQLSSSVLIQYAYYLPK